MAKPALGRGLGNLLGDTQIADKPEPATTSPESTAAEVSPGLGNLLTAGRNGGGEKPAVPPPPDATSHSLNSAQASRPRSVYKPATSVPKPSAAEASEAKKLEEPEEAPVHAPRWALIAADLLLISLAMLLVFKSPAPLKPWEMTLCLAAVMMGAVLACVAALIPPRR